jgi:hypothetical protein
VRRPDAEDVIVWSTATAFAIVVLALAFAIAKWAVL